jgi:hypothetical protein
MGYGDTGASPTPLAARGQGSALDCKAAMSVHYNLTPDAASLSRERIKI